MLHDLELFIRGHWIEQKTAGLHTAENKIAQNVINEQIFGRQSLSLYSNEGKNSERIPNK